jgi:long-chain acyl-CoA synthetase
MAIKSWFDSMNARGERTAYQYCDQGGVWQEVSWLDYSTQIRSAASAMIELGLKAGDRISIFSSTRWEWAVTDMAALSSQKLTVPVYPNLTKEELIYIFNHSKPRVVFAENLIFAKTILDLKAECPSVERIVVFEGMKTLPQGLISFSEFLKLGSDKKAANESKLEKLRAEMGAETAATVLYTSGTTGKPKGVLLTQAQIVSEVEEAFTLAGVHQNDVSLSFLPYSHVLGRIELWGHAFIGFRMCFSRSIETVRADLLVARPTIMVAVPRIFEKVYAAIQVKIESSRVKKKMFEWALKIGLQASDCALKGQPVPFILIPQIEIARRLVLKVVADAFGGRLKWAISGGAPMNPEIARFFHACQVLILEGYGLTETTGAITVNTPYDFSFGCAGKPIGDVKIKFADDGEILVRSQKVMKEYYLDPKATSESFVDGWFMTGDIGEMTPKGLKITDRKKDLIKTSGGKYVAPQKLEGLMRNYAIVNNVHIHGDQKKFIVALVTVNADLAKTMGDQKKVDAAVHSAVSEVNSQLSSYESIKKYLVLPNEFTVESGELTPSMKVKRKVIDQKYKAQIDSLYS